MTDADHFFDPVAAFRAEKERAAAPAGRRVSYSTGQRLGATTRWAKRWLLTRLVHRSDAATPARHRASRHALQT